MGSEPAIAWDGPPDGVAAEDIETARAEEYAFLARLFARAPDQDLLDRIALLPEAPGTMGRVHGDLARAARSTDAVAVAREHFNLFVGVGRGEFLPFASYYLTGFLNERPLASVRRDLAVLGLARAEGRFEPEDHVAILCEVMAELASRRAGVSGLDEAVFFGRHLEPWVHRFFSDLAASEGSGFYRAAGAVGAAFIEIETEAFALDAEAAT
jgi:TorA maturation chaperone TorD